MANSTKALFNCVAVVQTLREAQHHNITITAKMKACIHLSGAILSNHVSLGMDEPGRVSRIVVIADQATAGIKEGLIFFKEIFLQ